ncbi:hypothetical protein C2G38_2207656 [Gigaspora rosea]|uniref:Uncharacterized protein n=1 Tax=Gigaspora rosea TaxID=44941 RepID=A0A397UI95_9GLOM|nr:hypothetical protein C2G38_2207656 [Gigaspora rosea]
MGIVFSLLLFDLFIEHFANETNFNVLNLSKYTVFSPFYRIKFNSIEIATRAILNIEMVHLSQFVRQNGNPNQEPLHIALREIANAFRDATIGVAAAACPGFKRNEFGMGRPVSWN